MSGGGSLADPVVLTLAPTRFAAGTLVAVLEDAGIDAVALDVGRPASEPGREAARVAVHVSAADLEAARRLLAERRDAARDIDWETVDVGAREDDLPLHRAGRMPPAARIAFLIALLVVLVTVAAGVIVLVV